MVSREFPSIVTGYSHSVDVVVRRGLYLLASGLVRVLFATGSNFAPKREEMKKLAALTLSLFLAVGTVLADTPKDATPQAAKTAQKAKPRAAAKQADKSAEIAAQIEELPQIFAVATRTDSAVEE